MKNLFLTIIVVMFLLSPSIGLTQDNSDEVPDLIPAELKKVGNEEKKPDVEKIIERIEQRKVRVLARIKAMYERFPERLKKIERRIDRLEKRAQMQKCDKGKVNDPTEMEEIKQRITERYNKFKAKIVERKKLFLERSEKRRNFIKNKISSLKPDEQNRILEAFDKAQKEIQTEIEKLIPEAEKKLEETYQKLLSRLK